MSFREKFIENWGDDITKMTITRKIKIWKIWNLIILLFQPIADLSCKFYHFWENFFFWFSIKKIINFIFLFFLKWSNLQENGWIKRKIKFQIFPIYIFRVMVIFVMSSPQFSMNFSRKLICDRPYHFYFQIDVCWIFFIEIGP